MTMNKLQLKYVKSQLPEGEKPIDIIFREEYTMVTCKGFDIAGNKKVLLLPPMTKEAFAKVGRAPHVQRRNHYA